MIEVADQTTDKLFITFLLIVLPAPIRIAMARFGQAYVVENNCLTVREESDWPCRFTDMKYRKDGWALVKVSVEILHSSAGLSMAAEWKERAWNAYSRWYSNEVVSSAYHQIHFTGLRAMGKWAMGLWYCQIHSCTTCCAQPLEKREQSTGVYNKLGELYILHVGCLLSGGKTLRWKSTVDVILYGWVNELDPML